VYSVESEQHALEQVAALPAEALPRYAELMTVLETAPWAVRLTIASGPMGTCARTFLASTTREW